MTKGKALEDKAIDIKGKKYVLVSDRITYFNDNYPNGSIRSEYTLDGDTYHFKATVTPDTEKPERQFIGHSQATIGDGMVNKSAAMENAETSAWGRALGAMGIGVIESIASADEMNKATGSSGMRYATPKQVEWMRGTVNRYLNLDGVEAIDKAIEEILTVKPEQVPLSKVKAAVDKIEAAARQDQTARSQAADQTELDVADMEQEDIKKLLNAVDDGSIPF